MITNDGRTTRHRRKNKQGKRKDPSLLMHNASSDRSLSEEESEDSEVESRDQ